MIAQSDKQMAMTVIDEAVAAGARMHSACQVLGISERTLGRWRKHASLADARKAACKHCPQVLTEQDTQRIVQVYNSPKCATAPSTKACHRRRSCRAWLMWVVHRQRVKLLQSAAHIGPTILTNTATDRG